MLRNRLYLSTIDGRAGEIARKTGLGVEIAEFCTASNMDEGFPEADAAVRKQIAGVGRRMFHAPFNELFPCAIDPKARELARSRYRQAIALAGEYGAKRIVIHGGYHPCIYFPVWYTEQSVIFWRDFMKETPEDVTILLENVLEEEPEMLLDVVRGVEDPRLGLCLDVGHVNAYSKIPVMDWLERCGDWIGHFHIHNNDGSGDTHSPLDRGTIPMKGLLTRAEERCPEATYTLELTDCLSSVRALLEESQWNRN